MSQEVKNNKFIGAFVNEMYAILLGIGLGNVLFVQQIDLSNNFEILMGLFVTGVILLYWWDWTEFLSDNVVSSKAEFIIDFLILISLEVLFLFYNKPINLAIVFIILAFLDLSWVISYIVQNKGNFIAKNKTWIAEKIIAIIIFIGTYILIRLWLSEFNLLYQGLTLILVFIIVRKISFKQVKNAPRYNFDVASIDDFNTIADINNSYLDPNKNTAFMITKMSKDIIETRIRNNYQYYVLRKLESDEILGFIELSDSVGNEILNQVNWLNEKYENEIKQNKKILYVEKIAVDKNYKKQGIGEALYKNLFAKYENYSFYAFVMDKPHTNLISMNFHEKLGFNEVGVLKLKEYNVFKNYQSKIFYKK